MGEGAKRSARQPTLLLGALKCPVSNTDQFPVMLASTVMVFFVLLVASNQLTGKDAWCGFLGITVASRLYYRQLRRLLTPSST